jgi:hypothetical protein
MAVHRGALSEVEMKLRKKKRRELAADRDTRRS